MKVLIADDNAVVRMGLVALLARIDDVEVVIESADGLEALERMEEDAPDVALLDVRMPRLDGLGVLERMPRGIPALMLTHSEEPDIVRLALQRGARGYLVHGQVSPDEIAAALRTCAGGGMVLSGAAAGVLTAPAAPSPDDPHPFAAVLTAGELAVLEAAARGEENAAIAADLFLSVRTVKNYLNAAYGKLDVHSRAEAVAAWHEAAASGRPGGLIRGGRP